MLQKIDDTLWIAEDPLRIFGIALGRRMTVIGLPDGGLFVHSPWEMTADRKRRLLDLGPVRSIVAPGRLHDLYRRTLAQRDGILSPEEPFPSPDRSLLPSGGPGRDDAAGGRGSGCF